MCYFLNFVKYADVHWEQAETPTGMVAKKNNKGLPTLEGISWKTLIDLIDLLKYMEETVM